MLCGKNYVEIIRSIYLLLLGRCKRMSIDNSTLLNRVFTRNTLREILEYDYSEVYAAAIRKYVSNYLEMNNRQLISAIYKILKREYRNEYYYKNTILNKLLLGVHKPTTTTALTEIAIEKSKADFVLINGSAIVYEIKTELDNFDRLESQILNYYRAFSRVSILSCEDYCDSLVKRLSDTPVGICLLTRKSTIKVVKEPQEYSGDISNDTLFKILRKHEYESIIKKHFGKLPDVSQFEYYRACKGLFCNIDTSIAYTEFISTLKQRGKIDYELYNQVPYELKFLVYFSNLKKDDYQKLNAFLQRQEVYLCTSLI